MLAYVGYLISLVLYVVVVLSSTYTIIKLNRLTLPACFAWSLRLFSLLLIALATMFLYVQLYTVPYEQYHYYRLVYDIFNGFVLMVFTTVVDIYLGWKQNTTVKSPYRRRAGDYPTVDR